VLLRRAPLSGVCLCLFSAVLSAQVVVCASAPSAAAFPRLNISPHAGAHRQAFFPASGRRAGLCCGRRALGDAGGLLGASMPRVGVVLCLLSALLPALLLTPRGGHSAAGGVSLRTHLCLLSAAPHLCCSRAGRCSRLCSVVAVRRCSRATYLPLSTPLSAQVLRLAALYEQVSPLLTHIDYQICSGVLITPGASSYLCSNIWRNRCLCSSSLRRCTHCTAHSFPLFAPLSSFFSFSFLHSAGRSRISCSKSLGAEDI